MGKILFSIIFIRYFNSFFLTSYAKCDQKSAHCTIHDVQYVYYYCYSTYYAFKQSKQYGYLRGTTVKRQTTVIIILNDLFFANIDCSTHTP